MKKVLLIIIAFTIAPAIITGQTTSEKEQFKGRTYEKMNGHWTVKVDSTSNVKIVPGTICVKYKKDLSSSQISNVEITDSLGNATGGNFGWHDYNVYTDSVFSISKSLLKNTDVKNVIIPTYGTFNAVPNDPIYIGQQWYFDESEAHPTIKLEPAWDITTGNPDVKIAILDAGIDWEHTDFGPGTEGYDNIYRNAGEDPWDSTGTPVDGDGIDNDGNGFVDDWMGWDFRDNDNDTRNSNSIDSHGLEVAGVVGAKTNNNNIMSGVAGGWKIPSGTTNKGCELIICRIGDADDDLEPFNSIDLRDGIAYAIENGADIINLSLSLQIPDQNITDAIKAAYDEGITIISSSGNTNQDKVRYPASLPEVVSVGATDLTDHRWEGLSNGSSYGPKLDLSAPGVSILSLSTFFSYGYTYNTGTSYSTPIVSGVAGLMKSVNSCLGPEQIRNLLANTADKVGGYQYNPSFHNKPLLSAELGHGKVNAHAAVQMALDVYSATLDLYMKDRFEDMGIDTSSYPVDDSPDIWVRNIDDDGVEHQTPYYSANHTNAFVYVSVRNKSCPTSSNMTLSVYYTPSSTSYNWQSDFILIGQKTLPPVAGGDTIIRKFKWDLNSLINENGACLIAVLNGPEDPSGQPTAGLGDWITSSNNVVSKNLIVDHSTNTKTWQEMDVPCGGPAYVKNDNEDDYAEYHVIFGKQDINYNETVLEQAEINLFVDDEFWNIVNNSPEVNFNGIEIISDYNLRITEPDASIENLFFEPGERFQIYTGFNFYSEYAQEENETYYYSVSQKEASDVGKWKGAVHFRMIKEARERFFADGGSNKTVFSQSNTTLNGNQINEPADYKWYNLSDSLLAGKKSLLVAPSNSGWFVYEVTAKNDHFKDYDTVFVKVNHYKIQSLSPNPATSQLMVSYVADKAATAFLTVQMAGNPKISYTYPVNPKSTSKQINISYLQTGIYNVYLICDGEKSVAEKLIVQ
ncbi:MAG: S8 family serine peptidase [Bacteroidales bacterium]